MTEPVHKLGEVLRAAREAKGIDLVRAERETKIRSRYLSALESGEYRDLPGAVYVRGFLRNYGLYLGLDPEYLIDLYRLETAAPATERPTVSAPPRPIAARRRRTLVVTPGAVVAAILTIMIGALVGYTIFQFNTFARTPELRITDPVGDVPNLGRLSYTLRGVTEPNARVTVDGLRENRDITADSQGAFEATVELVPGSNVITLVASDPVTNRESVPQSRTITVVMASATPSPTAAAATLALDKPVANASLASPVAIAGRTTPGTPLEIGASLLAAAPLNFAVVDDSGQPVALQPVPPVPPAPVAVTASADGAFASELALAPGSWEIRVAPTDGAAEPVTVNVTITAPPGLVGELRMQGGVSYLEVEQDGQPLAGVSGGISRDGDRVALQAQRELRIRAGNAAAVHLQLNGVELGAMGQPAAVVEWRITPAGS